MHNLRILAGFFFLMTTLYFANFSSAWGMQATKPSIPFNTIDGATVLDAFPEICADAFSEEVSKIAKERLDLRLRSQFLEATEKVVWSSKRKEDPALQQIIFHFLDRFDAVRKAFNPSENTFERDAHLISLLEQALTGLMRNKVFHLALGRGIADLYFKHYGTQSKLAENELTFEMMNSLVNNPSEVYQQLVSKLNGTTHALRLLNNEVSTKDLARMLRVSSSELKDFMKYSDLFVQGYEWRGLDFPDPLIPELIVNILYYNNKKNLEQAREEIAKQESNFENSLSKVKVKIAQDPQFLSRMLEAQMERARYMYPDEQRANSIGPISNKEFQNLIALMESALKKEESAKHRQKSRGFFPSNKVMMEYYITSIISGAFLLSSATLPWISPEGTGREYEHFFRLVIGTVSTAAFSVFTLGSALHLRLVTYEKIQERSVKKFLREVSKTTRISEELVFNDKTKQLSNIEKISHSLQYLEPFLTLQQAFRLKRLLADYQLDTKKVTALIERLEPLAEDRL